MKIAILISGEYRTFPICRKTMPFLDDLRVDVYVSTWGKSIVKNERLNLDINDTITEDGVRNDLKIPGATILIEPLECFVSRRYNDKMIHRWQSGFAMIKNSGIEYDYVLVMRPDLFFAENQFDYDAVTEIKDEFKLGWYQGDTASLQDNFFACSYKKMDELFQKVTVESWLAETVELDWHRWWTIQVRSIFTEVKHLATFGSFTFGRSLLKPDSSFADAVEAEHIWRDCGIIDWIQNYDRSGVINNWGEELVAAAEARRDSGFYEQYKAKKRIAVLIIGMLRNYDAALLSLPIFGDTDKYLVTWKSAGKNKIDDYIKKANIKQSIIVDDHDFESVYKYPYLINPLRVFHLWEEAYRNVPKDYDKYIIVRPDGFYWCTSKEDVQELIKTEGPFKLNQHRCNETSGLNDHLFFIDKSHFGMLENVLSEYIKAAVMQRKEGKLFEHHTMLYRLWKQNIAEDQWGTNVDFCSPKMNEIIDIQFVRDTFKLIPGDEYSYKLYKSIFYDTGAWCHNYRCHYEGWLRQQLPGQK